MWLRCLAVARRASPCVRLRMFGAAAPWASSLCAELARQAFQAAAVCWASHCTHVPECNGPPAPTCEDKHVECKGLVFGGFGCAAVLLACVAVSTLFCALGGFAGCWWRVARRDAAALRARHEVRA